jgi:catechol 2,3-dioxygenase-like lactoylglutathione lyase family enzyme
MQTRLSHIQFNVGAANIPYYKELMSLLGWQAIYDSADMFGAASKDGVSFWFNGHIKEMDNDYDGPGMNHIGINTGTQAEVDAVATFLKERGVEWLFETPRHRPEFTQSPDQTYYQVMFETPDHILMEVVYTGPKNAA